jgi:hypothetical protein
MGALGGVVDRPVSPADHRGAIDAVVAFNGSKLHLVHVSIETLTLPLKKSSAHSATPKNPGLELDGVICCRHTMGYQSGQDALGLRGPDEWWR